MTLLLVAYRCRLQRWRAWGAFVGVAAVWMRSGRMNSKPSVLVLAFLFVTGFVPVRATAGIPPPVQAAILQKIFAYDKALAAVRNHRLVIVEGSGAAELSRAFSGVGFSVQILPSQKLDSAGDISAIYVLGNTVPSEVASVAEARKILTIAGDESLAEGGKVSVALGVVNGKPQIVVHLGRLTAEGHKFSAELLALARVVR